MLGGGGFRGRASLGVLRRLRAEGIPIDSLLGVSAGALISGYHAAVGWDPDECIAQVAQLDTRMLLAYGASRSRIPLLARLAHPYARDVRRWVEQLDTASWEELHHGVRAFGVLAFDLKTRGPVLFATGLDNDGITVSQAVRASAAVPVILGPVDLQGHRRAYRLVDGGVAESLPVAAAFEPPFSADYVLAVNISRDPRTLAPLRRDPDRAARLVVLRPRVGAGGTIITRRASVEWQVRAGEAAVTPDVLSRLRGWLG